MNYSALFDANTRITGGRFTLALLPEGGRDMHCFGDENYAMIFCLEGSVAFDLRIELKTQRFCLPAENLVVIDKRYLKHCICRPGTVLLKYAVHGRLARYMAFSSQAFQMAASSVVVIMPKLKSWIGKLVEKMIEDRERQQYRYIEECRELSKLLIEYPKSMLMELYVPIFACSRLCKSTDGCLNGE